MHESIYVIIPVLLSFIGVLGFILWVEILDMQRSAEASRLPPSEIKVNLGPSSPQS